MVFQYIKGSESSCFYLTLAEIAINEAFGIGFRNIPAHSAYFCFGVRFLFNFEWTCETIIIARDYGVYEMLI